ncbi:hypothetical protein [Bradyrhizobium sp. McL0616]|uniref:hypothetical protein n=1 Tax=Bradyrhizobium sp. McL0616 TaxID=3415674 RepID=UPI003CEB93FB
MLRELQAKLSIAVIAFFAGMSATLFLIPFWAPPLKSAIEEGKPADWIGFAGNFGAGIMTLIGAAAAIYGAMFAARPVYDQLLQQGHQNDIASLGVLSKRAADLNGERILILRILSGVLLIGTHQGNLFANPLIPETGELGISIDRFEEAVDDLRSDAGIVWGSAVAQRTKRDFLDAALDAATNIVNVNRLHPPAHPQRRAAFQANVPQWNVLVRKVMDVGSLLQDEVDRNAERTAAMLVDLEHRIF